MTNNLPAVPAPTANEWEMLAYTADRIARTKMVPSHFQGKPDEILAAALYGREIGLGPMAALQRIIVINGKPTLDAQGMAAVIQRAGHTLTGDADAESATAIGIRADTGAERSFTFTIGMARDAGLVKPGPWKQYPHAMLWARAVTQLARMHFADVLSGFSYTPEEMGAVDVDVAVVEPVDLDGVRAAWEAAPEHSRPDWQAVEQYAGKSEANAAATIERLTELAAASDVPDNDAVTSPASGGEEVDGSDDVDLLATLNANLVPRVEIGWDDLEDVSAAEIKRRKALMPALHATLSKVMDDDAKDRLLRGALEAGSWKLVPSALLKEVIAGHKAGGDD